MNKRQKIIVSITGIFMVLLVLVGLTYAYFLTQIKGNINNKSINVTTANLKLVYNDGTDGIIGGEQLFPGDTEYSKTFTVKNEGNANIEYGVYLINVINTFTRKDDIKYTITCNTDGTLPCGTATSTTFPNGIKQVVTASIEPNKTHTYTFKFTYKDTGTDQSVDMGKELSAKIQIFGKNKKGEYLPYEEGTLAYSVINYVKNGNLEGKTTFIANLDATGMVDNITTATDKILSTANDDYGTSYYFRGNPIDNYVNYADMCWRIVRIQGDGSAKLILASELPCTETNLTTDSGYITDGTRGVKGTMFTGHYGYKIQNTTELNDYINSPEYNFYSARTQLNSWLNRKITAEEQNLLKNEQWCIGDLTNAYNDDNSGEIIGVVDELIANNLSFKYTAGNRYWATKTPTYECKKTGKEGEIDVNKIGMLTFDEIVYAGGGNISNSNYFLNKNAEIYHWWSLSSNGFHSDKFSADAFIIYPNGRIGGAMIGSGGIYIRASISLKSDVLISDGVGTINDPFIISMD